MRRVWRWFALVLVAAVIAFLIWFLIPLGPLDGVSNALVDGDAVAVDDDPWLTFSPLSGSATGLIFYPGARVHRARHATRLAEHLSRMPRPPGRSPRRATWR